MISRRRFLKILFSTGAALFSRSFVLNALAEVAPVAAPISKRRTGDILKRSIPSTGESIPVIGLGTWQSFYVANSEAELASLREVIRLFYEAGGRLIDTAPRYGMAEGLVGRFMSELGLKGKAFIATKVWAEDTQTGILQMEASMAKLGIPQIDLMQVHSLVGWQTQLKTLREWKENGKFRYIGVTVSSVQPEVMNLLERVMRTEKLDFVQQRYSITARQVEKRILPLARDKGMAFMVNLPFDQGGLFKKVKGQNLPPWAKEFDCTSWAQFFLKFVLSHPTVTCIIPATGKPHHVVDNIGAGYGRLPDRGERLKMIQYFQGL